MRRSPAALDALSALLVYPGADLPARAARARDALLEVSPAAARAIEGFARAIETLSEAEREEVFTRTFDLNPVCCLEVGWHLWGDRYERGDFLVRIRGLLREHGVAENGELPDHLSHVLVLLARLPGEVAEELRSRVLAPALGKMSEAISGTESPWRGVLDAVLETVVPERERSAAGKGGG